MLNNKIKKNTLAKIAFFTLLFTTNCLLLTAHCLAQGGGQQHYNSPLYSPRDYEQRIKESGSVNNGIPAVLKQVGIEQKLNSQLPLDATFLDENGEEVKLGKYFGKKPVIIALVYYECPMLCNEVLNGLVGAVKPLNFDAGKEFEVVAISFNPNEKPDLAKAKKESYLARYNHAGTENGWHFLTGSQNSIESVANAVGYHYQWDESSKQYAHAGGIMMSTPEGKMSRYFYGIEYAPKEVRLGLIESAANKIGNPVDQLVLYCYHYDPSTGKYGLVIMRVMRLGGIITLIGMAVMLIFLRQRGKKVSTGNLA
ncbi:MAG: SCO family protein [Pyrinomonadaceae bacterium]